MIYPKDFTWGQVSFPALPDSVQFSSVTQLCLILCDPMDCSMPGFPVPSLSPGICSKSCPLSWWCHPAISYSVTPFSSCPQSFPESGSFPMNWLLTSGGQSTGASASASVFLINIQDWFPLGLTDLIPLLSKGLSSFLKTLKSSCTTVQKHQFFGPQTSLWSNSHIRTWLLEKPYPWLTDLCWQSDVSSI